MSDEICSALQNNFKYDNVHRSYSIVNWNLFDGNKYLYSLPCWNLFPAHSRINSDPIYATCTL